VRKRKKEKERERKRNRDFIVFFLPLSRLFRNDTPVFVVGNLFAAPAALYSAGGTVRQLLSLCCGAGGKKNYCFLTRPLLNRVFHTHIYAATV
jgi:hypothetical protein